MSNGILITYSGYPYNISSFMPDNGLANLASALLKAGHNVLILDFNTVDIVKKLMANEIRDEIINLVPFLQEGRTSDDVINKFRIIDKILAEHRAKELYNTYFEIKDIINKRKPNFIGFKLWAGDGFADSITLAEFIKKDYFDIKLYAGGPQVQLFRETIYKKTQIFDAIAYAEGEEIISLLADHSVHKKELRDIPNIIYMDSGKTIINPLKRIANLDDIPLPVYDPEIYPAFNFDGKIKIFSIDDSRGCPNNCAYCVHSSISGTRKRKKSIDRIINEMKYLMRKYHSRVMRFSGSNTPTDLLVDLSNRLVQENLNIVYSVFSNLQGITPAQIDVLKKSGLFAIFVGIESANKRILKKDFNKPNNPAKLKKTIKLLMDAGIFIVASFIYPAPSEDDESRLETLNYILELFNNPTKSSVTIQFPGLFPLGKWWEHSNRYGFEVIDKEEYKMIGMKYNIKHYQPLSCREYLPYKIHGVTQRDITFETSKFINELNQKGVLTMLLDDAVMMSNLIKIKPADFKQQMSTSLFTGDCDKLKAMALSINNSVY